MRQEGLRAGLRLALRLPASLRCDKLGVDGGHFLGELPSREELGPVATALPDGNVYMDGEAFDTPSKAATALRGEPTNVWEFWNADLPEGHVRLRVLREEYLARDAVGG